MKKLIGMAFVALFMMSMTSNKEINVEERVSKDVKVEERDCYDQMATFIAQADACECFSEEEMGFWANGALAVYCYGYSWDDVFGN